MIAKSLIAVICSASLFFAGDSFANNNNRHSFMTRFNFEVEQDGNVSYFNRKKNEDVVVLTEKNILCHRSAIKSNYIGYTASFDCNINGVETHTAISCNSSKEASSNVEIEFPAATLRAFCWTRKF
jgi:hypothetical protein